MTTKSRTAEYVRNNQLSDTITFTREEYALTIENIEDGAVRDAACNVWEAIKADVEHYWRIEDGLRAKGGLNLATTRALKSKLDAYGNAMRAMGFELRVVVDGFDPAKRVYEVGSTFGTIRSYAKASW